MKKDITELLPQWCASWIATLNHIMAKLAKPLDEQSHLSGFARSVDAVKAKEHCVVGYPAISNELKRLL